MNWLQNMAVCWKWKTSRALAGTILFVTALCSQGIADQPRESAVYAGRYGDTYFRLAIDSEDEEHFGWAKQYYEKVLGIVQEIAAARADDVQAQHDLYQAHVNLAVNAATFGDIESAAEQLQAATKVAQGLSNPDLPSLQELVRQLEVQSILRDFPKLSESSEIDFGESFETSLENLRGFAGTRADKDERMALNSEEKGQFEDAAREFEESLSAADALTKLYSDQPVCEFKLSDWYRTSSSTSLPPVGDAYLTYQGYDTALLSPSSSVSFEEFLSSSGIRFDSAIMADETFSLESAVSSVTKAPSVELSGEETSREVPSTGTAPENREYIPVEVFYATDRQATRSGIVEGQAESAKYFGSQAGPLQYGRCVVTIPPGKKHTKGVLEHPSIWRLEFQWDPRKHVMLSRVEPLDEEVFFNRLTEYAATEYENQPCEGVMVFVHGFNVSFEDAARRTAQMKYDVNFHGPAVFFSWPSQGGLARYTTDEEYVQIGAADLEEFLGKLVLRRSPAIHLIAHSMGSRVMSQAIERAILRANAASNVRMFNQLVLAAPDISAEYFTRVLAPAIRASAERVTIYVSENDKALQASRHLHGGVKRFGEGLTGVKDVEGIEIIDASRVDTSEIGHFYYGESSEVLQDLRAVLRNKGIDDQSREIAPKLDLRMWVLKPATEIGPSATQAGAGISPEAVGAYTTLLLAAVLGVVLTFSGAAVWSRAGGWRR